jgi:TonB family protein
MCRVPAAMLALMLVGPAAGAQDITMPPPYFEFQVDKRVTMLSGTVTYPAQLRAAGIQGEVLANFVVDDSGRYEPLSFRPLRSNHEAFTQAVRWALPSMRFTPAELGGKKVRQLVQQPFTFAPSGAAPGHPGTFDPIRPTEVRFGASLAELQKLLEPRCSRMSTRRIDPPFRVLKDIKDKQFQIDCEGYMFSGRPRHAEFIVADDALELVWIMTEKDEAASLFQMIKGTYGEPDATNAKFYAFTRARAALRIDVPEVLFYSERLAPRVVEWFGPNSTF